MGKHIFVAALAALILSMSLPVFAEVTPNDRLLRHPEWDGAIVRKPWLETAFTYQRWDSDRIEANAWSVGPTFISPWLSNRFIELGGRFDAIYFDPKGADSETGLSDIDVWGKYQLIKNGEYMLSVGALLTLPSGSDKIMLPRSSGEVNGEIFVGGRYNVNASLAMIAHAALRYNSDRDVIVRNIRTEVNGNSQFAVGGGAIYEVNSELNLQGEINFATEAYDNYDNDFRLGFGAGYELRPDILLKSGLGIGLDDGAPDWDLTVRCLILF